MKVAFRYHLLALTMLVGVAAPLAAIADASISNEGGAGSGSLDDRVAQLERITSAQGDLLTQLQQQVSDQQRDIEFLRGQIQQNQYELGQSRKQADESPQTESGAEATAGAATGGSEVTTTGNAAVPASSGDPDKDYNIAVSLALEKKQYDDAIVAFQQFVKKYPDSTYQPNANYWLGQLYYNKGKKDDASYYFAYVVKNYPKSPKSPDAMLKVGLIMQDKGDKEKAKAVYSQLIKVYPQSDAARQAQNQLNKLG